MAKVTTRGGRKGYNLAYERGMRKTAGMNKPPKKPEEFKQPAQSKNDYSKTEKPPTHKAMSRQFGSTGFVVDLD